eukprot:5852786-Pyramimonas_sp.AAC.1
MASLRPAMSTDPHAGSKSLGFSLPAPVDRLRFWLTELDAPIMGQFHLEITKGSAWANHNAIS